VIGVDTRDLKEISVTRLARTLEGKEIELQVARAWNTAAASARRQPQTLTFDRDVGDIRLDASNSGAMAPVSSGWTRAAAFRCPVSRSATMPIPARQDCASRHRGRDVETAVLTRAVERNDILKILPTLVSEAAPEGQGAATPRRATARSGCRCGKQLRAGQALRIADLAKPDMVQRDQTVTLIYESSGLYLTIRGKALDNGTEGDVVSVLTCNRSARERRRDRPRPGSVFGRDAPPSRRCILTLGSRDPGAPVFARRRTISQCLQKAE